MLDTVKHITMTLLMFWYLITIAVFDECNEAVFREEEDNGGRVLLYHVGDDWRPPRLVRPPHTNVPL